MKIPKGWTDYKPYGGAVEGTKLLPFKTPLKMELVQQSVPKEQWFTPSLLKASYPQLKAVIDLTDTQTPDRYYNPKEFVDANIEHLKIRIRGGGLGLPGMEKINAFSDAVERFVKKFSDDPDALIGVHCTHGLNRTGYFICKYMVMKMSCQPLEAIDKFQKARGYAMYRQNFIEEIISPGLHTRGRQIPDRRRPAHSVRPVQAKVVQQSNWRSRGPDGASWNEPDWRSFNSSSVHRRDRYASLPSTSHRIDSRRPAPVYSGRNTEYRSPLEGGYEEGCSSIRYRYQNARGSHRRR